MAEKPAVKYDCPPRPNNTVNECLHTGGRRRIALLYNKLNSKQIITDSK
jgi:hypothetical protein